MKNVGARVETCRLDTYGVEGELLEMIGKERPDIIFHIPYRDTFRGEILKRLTDNGHRTVCWNGDDEWLWDTDLPHNPKFISKNYKHVVTTTVTAVRKYNELGIDPIVSQWGYAASDWTPPKTKNRDIDVYFCGASTDERDRLLNKVKMMDVNWSFDGPGYGHHADKKNKAFRVMEDHGKSTLGKVPFNVMLNRYHRAKISLSFLMGASGNKPYQQVKARAFEIPASGSMQLAYNCPELARFFEIGKEVDVFDTEEEMLDKIEFYLAHDSIREKMARKGYERNLEYSYEKILKRVFKRIGL
jgi:spore maturation protein CgeB